MGIMSNWGWRGGWGGARTKKQQVINIIEKTLII